MDRQAGAASRTGAAEWGAGMLQSLLSALDSLDRLLERAAAGTQAAYGAEAASDPYRGLYIDQQDVGRLLDRAPGASPVQLDDASVQAFLDALLGIPSMARLKDTFELTPLDLGFVVVALAPEIDLRYERLYAYLQDDVTRKRPTVDLAINLLCSTPEARLLCRARFAADAPLVRHGLLHLLVEPVHVQPSLLAHFLKLDDQIAGFLLGHEGLDSRLIPFCRLSTPPAIPTLLPVHPQLQRELLPLARLAWRHGRPLRACFCGPARLPRQRAAEAVARAVGAKVLMADLARGRVPGPELSQILRLLLREAKLREAVLYVDGFESLQGEEKASGQRWLQDVLDESSGITILSCTEPFLPPEAWSAGIMTLSFPMPETARRRAIWEAGLADQDMAIDTDGLDALAGRFRLNDDQIVAAVASTAARGRWRSAGIEGNQAFRLIDLFEAAREQSGQALARLALEVRPVYTWDDIILPAEVHAQLREICQRVAHRHVVLEQWGFQQKLSLGKGVAALFAGPSGTGKTMAAEVIANELGLDLYKIDLASMVSKYIGETEKNLDRVFRAAEESNAILFFDEADAIFGKRSEVHDSHDRYANIEVSYLLQKMEEYEGVALLATNLRQNLDESFTRRLTVTVHFPFPDEVSRKRIWAGVWPAEVPFADDVNLDFMARQFKLSGGNIKNVALAAAFLAAEAGGPVSMAHLLHATRREYQKMGKVLSSEELSPAGEGKAK